MKISIYELLGLIKDGKAPKKIEYDIRTFELVENTTVIKNMYVDEDGDTLFDEYWWSLNDEVEILDEEDEFIDIKEKDVYMDINTLIWEQPQVNELIDNFTRYELAIDKLIKNQKKIIQALKENK